MPSPSIWTQCAASFKPRTREGVAWRVVESQHVLSTRKLVDSDDEQVLLETLVDGVKPPLPTGDEFRGLHYLLSSPFRHPPLRHGSRFGRVHERGVWYGSLEIATCFAEVAYYRLLFLDGTAADLGAVTTELTAFTAGVHGRRSVDLTRAPFRTFASALTSKTSYEATQSLGTEMRAAGVDLFLFTSARAPDGGVNVGLFSPAFSPRRPKRSEPWSCTCDREKVELRSTSLTRTTRSRMAFARAVFEVDGSLPSPST